MFAVFSFLVRSDLGYLNDRTIRGYELMYENLDEFDVVTQDKIVHAIAKYFFNNKEYDKAREFFLEDLKIIEKNKGLEDFKKGIIYFQLYKTYVKKWKELPNNKKKENLKLLDFAIEYLHKELMFGEEKNNFDDVLLALHQLGYVQNLKYELFKDIEFYKKGNEFSIQAYIITEKNNLIDKEKREWASLCSFKNREIYRTTKELKYLKSAVEFMLDGLLYSTTEEEKKEVTEYFDTWTEEEKMIIRNQKFLPVPENYEFINNNYIPRGKRLAQGDDSFYKPIFLSYLEKSAEI